jgi:hypothetical protein
MTCSHLTCETTGTKVHALRQQLQPTDLPEQSCLLGGSQSSQSMLLLLLQQLSSLRAVLGEPIALEPL